MVDWRPGNYMTQAVARVMMGIRKIADVTEYGYDDDTCVLGAYLRPGATVTFERPLESGASYAFVGGGGDDAEDVDILLIGPGGSEVAKDVALDASPVVSYTPNRSGRYRIRLTLYKASAPSFCVLGILRKGGWDVPFPNLVTAVDKCIALCRAVHGRSEDGARFHEENNQWALYGSVLRQGEAATVTNITLEQRTHAIVASGDNHAKDVDLYLLDSDGVAIVVDVDPDPTPVVIYSTEGHLKYGVQTRNAGSDGAALVITAILDL